MSQALLNKSREEKQRIKAQILRLRKELSEMKENDPVKYDQVKSQYDKTFERLEGEFDKAVAAVSKHETLADAETAIRNQYDDDVFDQPRLYDPVEIDSEENSNIIAEAEDILAEADAEGDRLYLSTMKELYPGGSHSGPETLTEAEAEMEA